MGDSIIKFTNNRELLAGLKSVFNKDDRYRTLVIETEKFVAENSSIEVAKKFIEMFKTLK
jgi:hypothetical protein